MASINGSYVPPIWWKRSVLVWEMIVLFWGLRNKINLESALCEFTTWNLPRGFKLQYVDYSNRWGIYRDDERNEPFRTNYINSVYCQKGPIYALFSICMRIKAAKVREIKKGINL